MISAPAIGFEYRPSAWPRRVQAAVGVLVSIAVVVAGIPWWLKLALLLAVALALLGAARASEVAPVAVGWSAQSGWTLRTTRGDDHPAELRSWRTIGPGTVLQLDAGSVRHTLWLLPDNCDADTRRRLRMRLAALGTEQSSTDR